MAKRNSPATAAPAAAAPIVPPSEQPGEATAPAETAPDPEAEAAAKAEAEAAAKAAARGLKVLLIWDGLQFSARIEGELVKVPLAAFGNGIPQPGDAIRIMSLDRENSLAAKAVTVETSADGSELELELDDDALHAD